MAAVVILKSGDVIDEGFIQYEHDEVWQPVEYDKYTLDMIDMTEWDGVSMECPECGDKFKPNPLGWPRINGNPVCLECVPKRQLLKMIRAEQTEKKELPF